MKAVTVALAFFLVGSTLRAEAGPSPEAKCAAAKRRASGAKIQHKMACVGHAKTSGKPVDERCLARAEERFASAFAKIGFTCAGSAPMVEVLVDACVQGLSNDIAGNGKCPGASARITGTWAMALMSCSARDLLHPGQFAACDAAADRLKQQALIMAGGCAASSLHTDLHSACVDPLVNALPPEQFTDTCQQTCGGTCSDPSTTCVPSFGPNGEQCDCFPNFLCPNFGKCVLGFPCDPDDPTACPTGYTCLVGGLCIGDPCASDCSCPSSATCVLNAV
jgi:hypothetical protein